MSRVSSHSFLPTQVRTLTAFNVLMKANPGALGANGITQNDLDQYIDSFTFFDRYDPQKREELRTAEFMNHHFSKMDQNGDGHLSPTELIDTSLVDGDIRTIAGSDFVTEEEPTVLTALSTERGQQAAQYADKYYGDNNGKVSVEELQTRSTALESDIEKGKYKGQSTQNLENRLAANNFMLDNLDKIDSNGDGELDSVEIQSFAAFDGNADELNIETDAAIRAAESPRTMATKRALDAAKYADAWYGDKDGLTSTEELDSRIENLKKEIASGQEAGRPTNKLESVLESVQFVRANHGQLDVDGDGQLSQDEISTFANYDGNPESIDLDTDIAPEVPVIPDSLATDAVLRAAKKSDEIYGDNNGLVSTDELDTRIEALNDDIAAGKSKGLSTTNLESRLEATRFIRENHEKLDINGDGQLSKDEINVFAASDENADTVDMTTDTPTVPASMIISTKSVQKALGLSDRWSGNKDGEASKAELDARSQVLTSWIEKEESKGRDMTRFRKDLTATDFLRTYINKIDPNGDDVLTKEEINTFAAVDGNADQLNIIMDMAISA